MKKCLAAVLAACLVSLSGAALAAPLHVEGLGTLPFGESVEVRDGAGTAIEAMFRRNMSAPQKKKTKADEFMKKLTVPPGMELRGYEDAPVSRVGISQLVTKGKQGIYTMNVFAFSGEADELFRGDKKKAAFWDGAFRGGKRLEAEDGGQTVGLDEYAKSLTSALEKGEGAAPAFRLLDASPWKPYKNDDETTRWQQQVKVVITRPDGFMIPLWIDSVLYRNTAGRYYLLLFTGSHASGRHMDDDILKGLYRIEREAL